MDVLETCECFVPTKKVTSSTSNSGKKRRKNASSNVASTFSIDAWERMDVYEKQWNIIETKLMRLTSSLFHKYVKKLYNFISQYSENDEKVKLQGNHQVGFNFGLIPTATIALNSKMTQLRIAEEVEEMISENDLHVQTIHLNSFNCVNMSALFQAFFNALIDDDIARDNDIGKKQWKNMSFDEIFQLWLNSVDTTTDKSYPSSLVIFVFDFENVNKQTLINLIQILKDYVKNVPITLVFLLSNQLNSSIQYFLPALATDNLMIEDIQSFYETKYIPQLLEELVVNTDIEFKIHPELLRQICDYFKNYEFSFSNFITFLKSLVFDYFYNNPLSVVCQTNDSLQNILQSNRQLLNIFRNSLPLSKANRNDDNSFAQLLVDQYSDLLTKHGEFTFNLQVLIELYFRCFYETQNFLALYCEMANEPSYDFKDNFLSPFLRASETPLNFALKKVLSKYKDDSDAELITTLKQCQQELADILKKDQEEEEKQLNSSIKLGLACDVKIVKNKLRNVNSRAEWRQSLIPKSDRKQQLSPFEQWRVKLVDEIAAILQRSTPSQHRYLVDSLFYNNLDFVRKHHFLSVRNELERSLSDSERSFKNIYPNSFILYELYKDASPVVNLYEWFELFCEEKKLNRKALSKGEMIVHFSTTLSDFDYIGLMQSSRYKADYLNKLVWL